MKKFFGMAIVGMMMTMVMLNARSAQASAPSTVLANILDKMTTAASGLRSLKANIKQQKTNTQLGIKGPVESGTLYYKPLKDGKSQLRIDYSTPDVKVLVVDGDKFQLYQPELKQMIQSSIQSYAKQNSAGALSLKFDAGTKDRYNISYVRDEDVEGVQTSVLALVPKAGIASPFKHQEVWVDHKTWLPVRFQFTEKNNDVQWIQFGNLQQNIAVSKDTFEIKSKPGTQIIKG
jgi:outer membrane lipoprotein-sorting protein